MGGVVPARIRTWQGREELARGHRCGWPQGSHWVWEGTPSDDAVDLHLSRAFEHPDAASSSPIARPWGAMETPAGAGVDTAL